MTRPPGAAGYLSRYLWFGVYHITGLYAQDKFSFCKAEKGGVAVATPTDDNAADGNLDKYRVRLIWRRYTSVTLVASSYPYLSCKVIWFSKSNSSKNLFTLSKIIIARPPSHCHFLSANHMLLRRLFPACMQPYPLHKKHRPTGRF